MATMRPVEMYCCYDDHTWQDSHFVEIPADTPEDLIEEVAIARANEVFTDPSIMFIGMYSLPSADDWEAWKRHDGDEDDVEPDMTGNWMKAVLDGTADEED